MATKKSKPAIFKSPGKIGIANASAIREEMLVLAGSSNRIELDLSELQAITTPGLQLLISLRRKLIESGGELTLNKNSEGLAKTIKELGVPESALFQG